MEQEKSASLGAPGTQEDDRARLLAWAARPPGYEEYELLQSFVRALRTRAKDDANWKTPPSRAPLPKHVRKYFVRVLVPPLFAHQKVQVEMLSKCWNMSNVPSEDARKKETLEQTMTEAKVGGSRLVAEGQHHLAIDYYQHAIVAFTRDNANNETPKAKRLAAQCHLNLALCLLAPQDATKAPEAIICCDAALGLLEANELALRAKALYRKGQALELQSKLELAMVVLSNAHAASPNEANIRAALECVRGKRAVVIE